MGNSVSDTTTGAYSGAYFCWPKMAMSNPACAGAHLSSLPEKQHLRHHNQGLLELVSGHNDTPSHKECHC